MSSHNFLIVAIVLLFAAVVAVPLSKWLGMGSVLGYLIAGIVIGPWGFGVINNVEDIMHFSEFGVVLFLFLIGLELDPKKLWGLRIPIFGMGGMQVILNSVFIAVFAGLLGVDWVVAILAGMGFSLSSTAIGLQAVQEKSQTNSTSGKAIFSILLFQDMAVIPMIAMLPLFAPTVEKTSNGTPAWIGILKIVGILALVILLGRIVLRRILKTIAGTHLREIFTAFALLLVLGMAWLMTTLDISMGLGAFMAGVLLADSEYRHALETDIEPFKGLLLGLFFMSVGMSIDFHSIVAQPGSILTWVTGIVAIKIFVHYLVARVFVLPKSQRIFFSIVISQVGEFAFVFFGVAKAVGVIDNDQTSRLMDVVALSMVTTPILIWVYDKFIISRIEKRKKLPDEVIEDDQNPVIIAGFGRFGQIIGRLLYANGIKSTVLDYEPDQIEILRRFGFKIYYGDATRMDLLEAAGIASAKVLVVAIDTVEDNLKIVEMAKQKYPHLKVVARARNLQHYYSLIDLKADVIEREVFEGSLKLGIDVLKLLKWPAFHAVSVAHKFRQHNLKIIYETHPKRSDEKEIIATAKQARADLEKMFEEEREILARRQDGWD